MATPLIQKLGSGILGTTSQEEIQKLSSSAGRSQQPVSPLEGSALGGTADQAKMLGSSANKQNAIRTAVRESSDLASVRRRQQEAVQESEGGQLARQRLGQLSMMGRIDEIAQKLAQETLGAEREILKGMQIASEPELDRALKSDSPAAKNPADKARFKELLQKLGSGTESIQELAELLNLTGQAELIANPENAAKELARQFFKANSEATASALAGTTADQLQIGQVSQEDLQTQLGFESFSTLADALDVTEEQLRSMTFADLSGLLSTKYNTIEDLQKTAVSPTASVQEREIARRRLIDLGITGQRALEQGWDTVQQKAANADTVEIAGREFTVAQLLSDGNLTAMVKELIEVPEGDFAQALRDQAPEFAAWVDANQVELNRAISELGETAVQLGEVHKANLAKADLGDGTKLSSDAMRMLYGDSFDKLTGEPLADPPVMQTLKALPPDSPSRSALVSLVNDPAWGKLNNNAFSFVKTLTPETLIARGLNTAEGVSRFKDLVRQQALLEDASPEVFITEAFGVSSPEDLSKLVSALQDADYMGLDIGPAAKGILARITTGDGSLKSTADIKQALYSDSANSLANFLNGSGTAQGLLTLKDAALRMQEALTKATANPYFDAIQRWREDGKVDREEVLATAAEMDPAQAEQMIAQVKLPASLKQAVNNQLTENEKSRLFSELPREIRDSVLQFADLDLLTMDAGKYSKIAPSLPRRIEELQAFISSTGAPETASSYTKKAVAHWKGRAEEVLRKLEESKTEKERQAAAAFAELNKKAGEKYKEATSPRGVVEQLLNPSLNPLDKNAPRVSDVVKVGKAATKLFGR